MKDWGLENKVNIWGRGSKSLYYEVKIIIDFLIEDKERLLRAVMLLIQPMIYL
jgi:hypothetical protein